MNKVYVVFTLGGLGFQNIAGIASSMEKAKDILKQEKLNTPFPPYIGIFELDEFPVKQRTAIKDTDENY
jgi:hypothetical protein